MTLVTAATGDYRELAENLDQSIARYSSHKLVVLSDSPCDVRENIVCNKANELWGGRYLKTRFALYLPRTIKGPVFFVDADCEATGDVRAPVLEYGQVTGVPAFIERSGSVKALYGMMVGAGDIETARELCKKWHFYLSKSTTTSQDEPSLNLAAREFEICRHDGTKKHPMMNLIHHRVSRVNS